MGGSSLYAEIAVTGQFLSTRAGDSRAEIEQKLGPATGQFHGLSGLTLNYGLVEYQFIPAEGSCDSMIVLAERSMMRDTFPALVQQALGDCPDCVTLSTFRDQIQERGQELTHVETLGGYHEYQVPGTGCVVHFLEEPDEPSGEICLWSMYLIDPNRSIITPARVPHPGQPPRTSRSRRRRP